MLVNNDFRDLFAALNNANADYLLVGGYAFALHVSPRYTKDLDVWVRRDGGNAQRVHRALTEFGAPVDALQVSDLERSDIVFQIGVPPNRIDILTAIDGVDFDEAWNARIETSYGDQPIHVIGRAHLLKNKVAAGRPQDLIDAQRLRENG